MMNQDSGIGVVLALNPDILRIVESAFAVNVIRYQADGFVAWN